MKSRIVILLSVTLAALLLVMGVVPKAMPTSPVLAQLTKYRYCVPFVCGTANDDLEGVKPGNYATTIEINNPNNFIVSVFWTVERLFPSPKGSLYQNPTIYVNKGVCIRCKQICTQLNMLWPLPKYIAGYVRIACVSPLNVYGVYTTETDTGLSIDVECIYAHDWLMSPE